MRADPSTPATGSGSTAAMRAPTRKIPVHGHAMRALLALIVALATYVAFPATPVVDVPLFEVGSVATQNVISPIAFSVPKDADELEAERANAARTVLPFFRFDSVAADSSLRLARQFMSKIGEAATGAGTETSLQVTAVRAVTESLGVRLLAADWVYLANERQRNELSSTIEAAIGRILSSGVAATGSLDTIGGNVSILKGDTARIVHSDSVLTFAQFLARARAENSALNSIGERLMGTFLTSFFRPTLVLDRLATADKRDEARDAVSPYRFEVQPQEAIIRANEVVGQSEELKLRTLRDELQTRQAGQRNVGRVVGAILFNLLLIGVFGLAVMFFRPQIYASFRSLATMAAIFTLVIAAAAFVSRVPVTRPELVPIAIVAITFAVLFDSRISMLAVLSIAALIGGQSVFAGTSAQLLNMIAGPAAVFSVRLMRQRNQAYYSMLSIAVAYALAALAVGLTLDRPVVSILESALYGGVNAVITVPFALLVLPLAEEFTGIDTYPRLLEWSDLNRPLMRQLSLEAPGTYAHTMTIANLSEAACNAIGANGMLARVGAYYHDIGKLTDPHYFVENQGRGRNPHDLIDPQMSAAIIRRHVTGGLELADKHRIPRTVRAFITEHHGTGPITYFLEKTTELEGPPINPDDFRYPGPIPQSAETAVVMLADAVEASARVLSEPTPAKLREVIDHIVRLRMEQGQLTDAPLTLRQLDIVKQEFTRVLSAAYHTRIDYPVSAGGITAGFAS